MPRAIVFPVPVRLLVGVARVLLPCAFLPLGVAVGQRATLRLREREALLIASCTEATLCW